MAPSASAEQMSASAEQMSAIAAQIFAIREFNRFYTARLGLLRKHHLNTEFSLTEGRTLYEMGAHPRITASALRASIGLDPGYISRLLSSLARRGLIRSSVSIADGREKLLTLTAKGEKAVARINELSDVQVDAMLSTIGPADRDALVSALARARDLLTAPTPVRIVRITRPSPAALAILEEYYQAVHVVLRDNAVEMRKLIAEPGSGMWLAYLGRQLVGCVVLRRLESIPHAAECKRLYVRPAARGRHIADLLLNEQEDFARAHGFQWIYLDTYHDLKTAITLYERRGYKRCKRYNNNPQATLFMRKRIAAG